MWGHGRILGVLALLVVFGCKDRAAPHQTRRQAAAHPEETKIRFDVVFVIDTTGSMQHLIDAARDRVREMAAFIQQGDPPPSVRFGIVAYRDKGEAYLTRLYDLSPDVGSTQSALAQLKAEAGGDDPEDVLSGLDRAIRDVSWDPGADLKMIFLIGDAGPHRDYSGPSIESVVSGAQEAEIRISAIPMGATMTSEVMATFQRIANETGGAFESITAEAMLETAVQTSVRELAKDVGVTYRTSPPAPENVGP